MQTKTEVKQNKKSNFKIRNSGIKFLYIKSPASLKPLSEQRLRKRKLFFSAHSKLVSASHSKCNSSFQIKAKSHTFFYISTDIITWGGDEEEEGRTEKKKPCNQHVFLKLLHSTFHSPMISLAKNFVPSQIQPVIIALPSSTSLESDILLSPCPFPNISNVDRLQTHCPGPLSAA